MMEPNQPPVMWREVNPQARILGASIKLLAARQEKPSELKNFVAGYWLSLFPKLRRDLALTIGDKKFNEKCFDDVWDEIEVRPGKPVEVDIRKAEVIALAIDDILETNSLFFTLRRVETSQMRVRR